MTLWEWFLLVSVICSNVAFYFLGISDGMKRVLKLMESGK